MKKLFKHIIGKKTSSSQGNQGGSPRDNRDSPVTIEDGSENATRRQLVQVLLRDVLRKSGIPPDWIECQMLLVASRTRGQGMYVRLVVRHWDERLMNYLVAFQQTLMNDIRRFEPNAEEWLHGISWQLDVGEQCPYPTLPCPARKNILGGSAAAIRTSHGRGSGRTDTRSSCRPGQACLQNHNRRRRNQPRTGS